MKKLLIIAFLLLALPLCAGEKLLRVHRTMLTCQGEHFEIVQLLFSAKDLSGKKVGFWLRAYNEKTKTFELEPVLSPRIAIRAVEVVAPKILLRVGGVENCKVWSQVLVVGTLEGE